MSSRNFEIDGLDNILNNLNNIQNHFPRELQRLVDKHGGILLRNVKQRTPVDTGQLRRSWELEKGDLYIKLFNRTEYALHVEYGHRTRGGRSYIEGVYMLKISFERQKEKFLDELEELLRRYGFR